MQALNHLTQQLNQLLIQDYPALSNTKNPIAQMLPKASFAQLTYVMQQYSIFPKELVLFTELARQKAFQAGWVEVAQELKQNIAEEMGSTTQGVSHYTLLAEGMEEGLGVSIKNTIPSIATAKLLSTLQSVFRQQAPYVLGATYAVEATSIPELTLVMQLIEWLLEGSMPENLQYFFDMHLNEWEPEHEAGLRTALAAYLQPEQFGAFEAGFRAVLDAMEIWWQDLAQEASLSKKSLTLAA